MSTHLSALHLEQPSVARLPAFLELARELEDERAVQGHPAPIARYWIAL